MIEAEMKDEGYYALAACWPVLAARSLRGQVSRSFFSSSTVIQHPSSIWKFKIKCPLDAGCRMDRFLRYPEFLLHPSRIQHPAGTIIVARNYSHWNPYRTRSSKPWQPPLHTTTFPWSYGNDFPVIDRQPPLLHLVILSTRFNRWFSVDGPSYSADFNSGSITNTDDDHRQPLTTSWIE